jgi:hypothetical protein
LKFCLNLSWKTDEDLLKLLKIQGANLCQELRIQLVLILYLLLGTLLIHHLLLLNVKLLLLGVRIGLLRWDSGLLHPCLHLGLILSLLLLQLLMRLLSLEHLEMRL